MNKTTFRVLPVLAALLGAASAPALAVPFVGSGSPGALAISTTGNLALNAGGGSATAAAASLVLTGGDQEPNGCTGGTFEVAGPCQIQAVYAVPGVYSFTWSYTTADGVGPGGDAFGVLVDGVRITLSDLGGAVNQGGNSPQYVAKQSFGWFINCTDCTGGAATVTISALAVPEPASWALALFGGAVLAARVRDHARRRTRMAGLVTG